MDVNVIQSHWDQRPIRSECPSADAAHSGARLARTRNPVLTHTRSFRSTIFWAHVCVCLRACAGHFP